MTILRSARLTHRPNTPSDLEAMHAIASDWDVVRNVSSWPWPADRVFTASRLDGVSVEAGIVGAVCLNGQVIGGMGIHDRGMGYIFGQAHWGQGYATEIGRILIDHCFARYDWDQITADVWADNPASLRVLTKLGFRTTGMATRPCAAQGKDVAAIDLALTRQDWVLSGQVAEVQP